MFNGEFDYTMTREYARGLSCEPPEYAKDCMNCTECVRCGGDFECLKLHFTFGQNATPQEKKCESNLNKI